MMSLVGISHSLLDAIQVLHCKSRGGFYNFQLECHFIVKKLLIKSKCAHFNLEIFQRGELKRQFLRPNPNRAECKNHSRELRERHHLIHSHKV